MKKVIQGLVVIIFLTISWAILPKSYLWFANAPSNKPVRVGIYNNSVRRPYCSSVLGYQLYCVEKRKSFKEFDLKPGEIVKADGDWEGRHVAFFTLVDNEWEELTQKGEGKNWTYYREHRRVKEPKPMSFVVGPNTNNFYAIGPSYIPERWGGSGNEWVVPAWPNQKYAGQKVFDVPVITK